MKFILKVSMVTAFRPAGALSGLVVILLRGPDHPSNEVLDYQAFQRKYHANLEPGEAQTLELYTKPNKPPETVNWALESLLPRALEKPSLSPSSKPSIQLHPSEPNEEQKPLHQDLAELAQLAKTMTVREIADFLGIKYENVKSKLRKAGVKAVSSDQREIERDRALFWPMVQTMTTCDIAEKLGKAPSTIRMRLIHCGLKAFPGKRGPKARA